MEYKNLKDIFGFKYTMPEEDFSYWLYVLQNLKIKENEVNLEFLLASKILQSIHFIDHDIKYINFMCRVRIQEDDHIRFKESYDNYKAIVKKTL